MELLNLFFSTQNSIAFNASIIVFFFFSIIRDSKHYNASIPNLLTSLGLLGTFTGILLGLNDFDHNAIDQSIPLLLAGLKLSFSSSVVGMVCSFLYKAFFTFRPKLDENVTDVTPEDIYSSLASINKAIGGNQDSSLTSQVSMMRTDIRDGNAKTVEALNNFAKELSKASVETIIEALKEVVAEFNQVIQEQFGENFKQLNQAVLGLVSWLDKYKEYLEGMQNRLDLATQSIERSEQAIESIRKETGSIPLYMSVLNETMSGLEEQRVELEKSLGSLAAIRSQAQEAFPVLEKSLGKFQNEYGGLLSNHLKQTQTQFETQTQAWQAITQKGTEKINEASNSYSLLAQTLEKTSKQHSDIASNAAQDMQQHLSKATEDINTLLNESFNNFDQAMQSEIKRVIEEMGSQLASLSSHFAHDYEPLTKNLKQLMNSINNGAQ